MKKRTALLASGIFFLALAISPILTQGAWAETAQAMRTVIENQISAFKNDDGSKAFSFASPGIQRKFGTPTKFLLMVEKAYPQIYRANRVRFLSAVPHGVHTMQKVLIEGPNGLFVTAVYAMVQIEGTWKIDGCWILKTGSNA